jgi:integrase/recombinase XerD
MRGRSNRLIVQTLLETGARVSEFIQLPVEDISLAERVVIIRRGKGGKRREVPIRANSLSSSACISAPVVPGRCS